MLSYLRKSPVRVSDIAIILAAVGGAAHILIRTSNYGPELDTDTWDYISVAENLTEGNGFKDYRQRNYVDAGPLYPMLVALFGLIGINPIEAGRFVSIIGFGLIILLVGCWLSRQVKFRFLAVVGSVLIMTSYSLSRLSSTLMTDTLFTLFTLLALFQIQLLIKSKDLPLSFLALSALFTGLAITTRYAGISILLTGIVSIFWKATLQKIRRLKCAIIYGSLATIPMGIWTARTWLFEETLVPYDNYDSSILDYLKTFSKFFISDILVLSPGLDWLIYLGCTVAFLIVWRRVSTQQSLQYSLLDNPTPDDPQHGLPISVFSIFVLISMSILLSIAPTQGTADQLGDRQLLTTYVPVIIVVLLLLDILLRRLVLRWKPLYFALVCLMSTGILGSISFSSRLNIDITAQALAINAEHRIFEKFGFSHNMEIWTHLRDNPIDGQVHSNGHNLLYWFTDIPFGGIIPDDLEPGYCLSWVQELTRSSEPSYIIYFTSQWLNLSRHVPQFNSCDIPALESDPIIQSYLERIGETPEAIVYQILDGTETASLNSR